MAMVVMMVQTKYVSVKHAFVLSNCHCNAIALTLTNIMMENTRVGFGALQPRIHTMVTPTFVDVMRKHTIVMDATAKKSPFS